MESYGAHTLRSVAGMSSLAPVAANFVYYSFIFARFGSLSPCALQSATPPAPLSGPKVPVCQFISHLFSDYARFSINAGARQPGNGIRSPIISQKMIQHIIGVSIIGKGSPRWNTFAHTRLTPRRKSAKLLGRLFRVPGASPAAELCAIIYVQLENYSKGERNDEDDDHLL